jgi:thiol-disulfide isomerase/thioredoxin
MIVLLLLLFLQLGSIPSQQPRDPGYVAEDPALARLVGTPGPSITLQGIDGRTIDLKNSYGKKPIYLKLWATYCMPCRAQMPGFEKIYETYGDRIQVVSVNAGVADDAAKVRAFVATYRLHTPVAIDDGSLGAWLKMEATPFHLLIGRDGRIVYAGHQDGARLDAALESVLAAPVASAKIDTLSVNSIAALKPGDRVPAIDLHRADGTVLQFKSGATAHPRAVLFTATWCESYLQQTEPNSVEACRRARTQADGLSQAGDVEWLGVVAHLWTTPKSLGDYQKRMNPRLPMAVDTDGVAFRVFGIRRLPAVALIGADGRLLKVVGPEDADLPAAIAKLRGTAERSR